MTNKHIVILNDGEQKMLERLTSQRGFRKQDLFRSSLRSIYRKEFPAYNEAKERWKDKFTNTAFCTKILGGRVEGEYCRVDDGHGGYTQFLLEAVKIHY